MATYKLSNDADGNLGGCIKTDENPPIHIPISSSNRDYQEYLEWVAEGNTAEAAD